jgi:hypothetical protein
MIPLGGVAGALVQLSCRPEKENEPGGIRTRDALIKRKAAINRILGASSQRKSAANLFDSQTIRASSLDPIRVTNCP